jgi:hypothetical protein
MPEQTTQQRPIPELRTRRPTGKPPWPMIVVAGGEKTGKSWCGAEFSASDLIDRTFWVEIGEGAADQYGALPGARYEIVEHDGTYQGIGSALWAATKQPRGADGKPHAIVVDGVTALWEMLSDEAQGIANARARRQAERRRQPMPEGDRTIGPDLWNAAKGRWKRIINLLRRYDGPVILLTRLEQVAVMGKDGAPTTDKTWSVKAEKNLPFEADAIVRLTAPRTAELTGVRSIVLQLQPGEAMPLPGFTIDKLLRDLGLAEPQATLPRAYTAPKPDWMEAERDAEGAYERRPQQQSGQQGSGGAQRSQQGDQRREPGRMPTFPPDAPRPQPTEVIEPRAPKELWQAVLVGLERKLDITDFEDQMRFLSNELRRHITTPDQLSVSEAQSLKRRLDKTPDRARPWDNQPDMAPGDDTDGMAENEQARAEGRQRANPAPARTDQDWPQAYGADSWSHRTSIGALLDARDTPLTDEQRAHGVADTIAEIGAAATEEELGAIGARVEEAAKAGRLRQADYNMINTSNVRRMEEIRSAVGVGG